MSSSVPKSAIASDRRGAFEETLRPATAPVPGGSAEEPGRPGSACAGADGMAATPGPGRKPGAAAVGTEAPEASTLAASAGSAPRWPSPVANRPKMFTSPVGRAGVPPQTGDSFNVSGVPSRRGSKGVPGAALHPAVVPRSAVATWPCTGSARGVRGARGGARGGQAPTSAGSPAEDRRRGPRGRPAVAGIAFRLPASRGERRRERDTERGALDFPRSPERLLRRLPFADRDRDDEGRRRERRLVERPRRPRREREREDDDRRRRLDRARLAEASVRRRAASSGMLCAASTSGGKPVAAVAARG